MLDFLKRRDHTTGGNKLHHTIAFWLGTIMLCSGVLMHLPDFFMYSPRFGGMSMDPSKGTMPISGIMIFGMVLIGLGFGLAAYGLFPAKSESSARTSVAHGSFYLRTMDDSPMTWAQWRTAAVLVVALIVDVMKPATLGFVIPGARAEYGLSPLQISMWPVVALTGTTIGSILWGMLADHFGRRSAILLASLMFVGTAICGAMPSYSLNLLMCFFMGMSAGGMLPIEFALFSETMPRRKRGFLLVLTAGLGTAGGYLVASSASAVLDPWFGTWRILWLLGMPTGLLVIVLRSFIPESPRFLLSQGRVEEARRTLASFGIVVEERKDGASPESSVAPHHLLSRFTGMGQLFRGPYLAQTVALVLLGVSWGLVNWGFVTWLPALLKDVGVQAGSKALALSALIALPGTVLAACMYGWWSSKTTMVIFAAATVAILFGFASFNTGIADHQAILVLLMVGLLVASTGVISMLMPYSAEVYDTAFRGQGTGLIAAGSKVAGIFGPSLVVVAVAFWPGLAAPALLAAVPMAVAALILGLKGIETRARRLEEIHATASASMAMAPDSFPKAPKGEAAKQKSPKKHDVIIIGGGPAGAAGAMFLAHEGIRSLIVEQEIFPRYHIGESLTGGGGKVLRDLGLDGKMNERRYPIKQGVKVYGNSRSDTWFVPVTGRDENGGSFDWDTWQVRRSEFDKMMLDEAVTRGATHLHGQASRPLRNDDGSVRGVEVRMADGGIQEIESEVLLDCSGHATFLANAGVTGPKYPGNYDRHIAIFSQAAGAIRDDGGTRETHNDNTLIFYRNKFHWAWWIPLDEKVVSLGVVVPAAYFQGKKESKRDFLIRELHELHPELKRRLPEINLVEDVHATPSHTYQVIGFCGKGFICIGDAHRFIDPIFSFGVTVAMREAQFAAPHIRAYLEGAYREKANPFAEHQLFCNKGADVLEDSIDLFWERPLTFASFVHSRHAGLIADVFAGRIYEQQPSAFVIDVRELLEDRQRERERSYREEDLSSIPVGSRFHPERASIWEINSPMAPPDEWPGRR